MSCFGKCLDLNKSVRLEIAFANSDNDLIANPIEINNTFKNYFLNLYTSESPESNSVMLEFLDNVDIPTLNSEQKTYLDKHIVTGGAHDRHSGCGVRPRRGFYSTEIIK